MTARFGMRTATLLISGALAGLMTLSVPASAETVQLTPVAQQQGKQMLLKGSTTASYYWDDSSGRNGDTGLPASGVSMQQGLVASPSWPMFTEGYVMHGDKKAPFFVGDRGPGEPSSSGVMLDLDAKTFAYLLGGTFNESTLSVDGVGGEGHTKVDYVITKWGNGTGNKNHPVSFQAGAWRHKDANPAKPIPMAKSTEPKKGGLSVVATGDPKTDLAIMAAKENELGGGWTGALFAGGVAVLGALFAGRDRIRKLLRD